MLPEGSKQHVNLSINLTLLKKELIPYDYIVATRLPKSLQMHFCFILNDMYCYIRVVALKRIFFFTFCKVTNR